jgi:hypothetical protein
MYLRKRDSACSTSLELEAAIMLKHLSFAAGLLLAANAFGAATAFGAECAAPTAPAMPNGAAASLDDMKAAQADMKKYLVDTDDFLKCLDFSHGADNTDKHNHAVDLMQKYASAFNEQLKAFKAAHPG